MQDKCKLCGRNAVAAIGPMEDGVCSVCKPEVKVQKTVVPAEKLIEAENVRRGKKVVKKAAKKKAAKKKAKKKVAKKTAKK